MMKWLFCCSFVSDKDKCQRISTPLLRSYGRIPHTSTGSGHTRHISAQHHFAFDHDIACVSTMWAFICLDHVNHVDVYVWTMWTIRGCCSWRPQRWLEAVKAPLLSPLRSSSVSRFRSISSTLSKSLEAFKIHPSIRLLVSLLQEKPPFSMFSIARSIFFRWYPLSFVLA